MENNELVAKRYKRAIFLVELATFFGCSIIMFNPAIYKNPFLAGLIFLYVASLLVGLLVAYLLVLVIRFIFRSFLREKLTYIIFLIILIILGYGIGILSTEYTWRVLLGTP